MGGHTKIHFGATPCVGYCSGKTGWSLLCMWLTLAIHGASKVPLCRVGKVPCADIVEDRYAVLVL